MWADPEPPRALLSGEAEIALYENMEDGKMAAFLHKDLDAARSTIEKMRIAQSDYGMHVALAHDESWMKSQQDPVLMSLLGEDKRGEWLERVSRGERP
jgi:hypothetical protein